ncbi:MAG: GNAT family N-acetyltransferase [Pseudomonadota bacterium]
MDLILDTDRLRLRPLEESDVDLGLEMLTDPQVMRYVGQAMSAEAVRAEMPIVTQRAMGGAVGIWCVTVKESGEKLGTGILLPLPIEEDDTDFDLVVNDDVANSEIEVGYLLKPGAWGRGYATEVCRRLLQFAFEETQLAEVVATFDPENLASRHVLLKCGLVDHGLRRAYAETVPDFRITREEWLASHPGK